MRYLMLIRQPRLDFALCRRKKWRSCPYPLTAPRMYSPYSQTDPQFGAHPLNRPSVSQAKEVAARSEAGLRVAHRSLEETKGALSAARAMVSPGESSILTFSQNHSDY